MATFNILSSCICRDAFGFQNVNPHTIDCFLQSTSALTWFKYNDKPQKPLSLSDMEGIDVLSKFQKKCIMNDYNKTVFDIFVNKADFFITDMTEFASMNIGKVLQENNEAHYFTFSKWMSIAYKHSLKNVIPSKVEKLNQLNIITDEIIEEAMERYVQWITEQGYQQEEVILVENKRSTCYTDGKLLYYFNGEEHRSRINEVLDKIYACFRRKMPRAHVVKMPIGVLADTKHKWGLTDLHFCPEYYDYLFACFDAIVNGCGEARLVELRDAYSEIFQEKRYIYTRNSFEYADGVQLLANKLDMSMCQKYVAPIGTTFYWDGEFTNRKGRLSRYFEVEKLDRERFTFEHKDVNFYVKGDYCVKGYIGNNKSIGANWVTINHTTLVIVKEESFCIGHSGAKSSAQTQIIQTLSDCDALAGKVVTFSVYARVLNLNNDNKGGTVAIINDCEYSKGRFYAKIDFDNKEWKRIHVSVELPPREKFKGITLCLRAIAGNGDAPKHALVEFMNPKFEIGSLPTKYC